jgi:hypothetical protein
MMKPRLEDVEWECESVSLPSPNDIPQYYHAPWPRMLTEMDPQNLGVLLVENLGNHFWLVWNIVGL